MKLQCLRIWGRIFLMGATKSKSYALRFSGSGPFAVDTLSEMFSLLARKLAMFIMLVTVFRKLFNFIWNSYVLTSDVEQRLNFRRISIKVCCMMTRCCWRQGFINPRNTSDKFKTVYAFFMDWSIIRRGQKVNETEGKNVNVLFTLAFTTGRDLRPSSSHREVCKRLNKTLNRLLFSINNFPSVQYPMLFLIALLVPSFVFYDFRGSEFNVRVCD